ncbi:hypothetical protein PTKIN_Ptkin06aG0222600 [Pterospermum kingtungense]
MDDPWLKPIAESILASPWNLKPHRECFIGIGRSSRNLSFDLKRVALKASASVVGILSHLGEKKIFRGSGFVIESFAIDGKFVSTILTSASILRSESHIDVVVDGIKITVILSNEISCKGDVLGYDFHYNIGVIKIETDIPIATARLRHIDDSISIDPNLLDEKPSKFNPISEKFNLVSGDTLVALGRFDGLILVAGEFSVGQTGLDCQELFRAEFAIPRHAIGGPLINCYGEVIGINFYCASFTPFLPINIVSMWWQQYKKNGHCLLPRLGMKMRNLYMEKVAYLEFVVQRFPNIFKGVVVDEVEFETPAYSTPILPLDVIVESDGKSLGSILEFFELIWDKCGRHVHLTVLRPSDGEHGSRLNVTMIVGDVGPNQFNRWPLPWPSEWQLARKRKAVSLRDYLTNLMK